MESGFSRGPAKKPMTEAERQRVLDQLHRETAVRAQGYRERALKLFPHVCASCGREFAGAKMKQLTVHHKDHDHDHNPPDGSNWELLCIYCHDNEHSRTLDAEWLPSENPDKRGGPTTTHNPFAALAGLLQPKADKAKKGEPD